MIPNLHVRTTDPTPPYEQLRRQVVDLIRAGLLSPGDRLPPLRQLAADLGLAVGTVARTYRELEAAGLVASRRGGGTKVVPGATPATAHERRSAVQNLTLEFIDRARQLGVTDAELLTALTQALTAPIPH